MRLYFSLVFCSQNLISLDFETDRSSLSIFVYKTHCIQNVNFFLKSNKLKGLFKLYTVSKHNESIVKSADKLGLFVFKLSDSTTFPSRLPLKNV